jgi:hypothetical protein
MIEWKNIFEFVVIPTKKIKHGKNHERSRYNRTFIIEPSNRKANERIQILRIMGK